MDKKGVDLVVGDIVVSSKGPVYMINLYLGTTTNNESCYYIVDSIYKALYYNQDACDFRLSMVEKEIKDFVLSKPLNKNYLEYKAGSATHKVVMHYDSEAVSTWYLKNRLVNPALHELYDKKEILAMQGQFRNKAKTFADKAELGMTFTTEEKRLYYVYLGTDNWFIKIKNKDMPSFRSGYLTSPYFFDYNCMINLKRPNRLLYCGELYDKKFLSSFISSIPCQ